MNRGQLDNPKYAELGRAIDSYRGVDGPLIQVLHRAQEIFALPGWRGM